MRLVKVGRLAGSEVKGNVRGDGVGELGVL